MRDELKLGVSDLNLSYGKAKVQLDSADDVKLALSKNGTLYLDQEIQIST